MRKLLFAVVALPAVVAVAAANAQPLPNSDYVVAQGTGSFDEFQFWFVDLTAQSGPAGENPTGSGRAGVCCSFQIGTQVTCLAVRGNTAIIGRIAAPITNSFSGVVRVADEGPPGSGLDTFDLQHEDSPDCSTFVDPPFQLEVQRGDIVVHDAQPLPTTKAQCKHGGWQTYGVFKNQGDCVSFVATGGKNPPAGGTRP